MSESIPDVILRLARRHLPVDAAIPVSPARPGIEPAELPIDAPTPSPREPGNTSIGERVSGLNSEPQPAADSPGRETAVAAPNPHTIAADPQVPESADMPRVLPDEYDETADRQPQFVVQASRLPSAGGTPAPQRTTNAKTDEPFDAPSDAEPPFERPQSPAPSFAAKSNPPYTPGHPAQDFADDPFEPAARNLTNAGGSRDQSPVEAVSEASRQLEQTARDLETSLTHLFTTQIETLERLRDRVDEQERRWVEQQAARRATL